MSTPVVARQQDRIFAEAMLHPLSLVSMAVWWLNDHVGKRHAPSALTGKLSDIACLVAFPVFVWCLVDAPAAWLWSKAYGRNPSYRRTLFWATTSLIVAWFAAINLSTEVGAIHRALWTSVYSGLATFTRGLGVQWYPRAHHTVDPTDILTLPAVSLAYYIVNTQVQKAPGIRTARSQLTDT